MSRPSDWSPLGRYSDPIPGEPEEVRKHAAHYNAVAEAIFTAGTRLQSIADYQTSESEFVNQFRDKATRVASDIQKAYQRYNSVGTATAGYAGPLETAQSDADAALTTARNARDDATTAQTHIEHYQQELMYNSALSDDEKTDYQHKLQSYQTEYNNHEHTITAAKNALQSAIDDRDKAAQHAISLISETQDTGGISDSRWEQFWDKYGDTITFWVGVIAAVALIVIAFIPGLDLIEFAILAVVAVVTIMKAVTQMETGKEPLWEGILEIGLSLLPIGGAAAVKGALGTAVEDAAKTAVTTGVKSAAARSIAGVTKASVTKTVEGALADASRVSAKNILKVATREGALDIAKLQAIAKLDLTAAGNAGKAGIIAAKALSHVPFYPGPGLEWVIDHSIEYGSEKGVEAVSGGKE